MISNRLRCINPIRAAACLAACVLLVAQPVAAQDTDAAGQCLDQQFDALSVQGDTRAARADSFQRATPDLDLPPFSERMTLLWCRALGVQTPDLQKFWPAQKGIPVLVTSDAADARKDMLARAYDIIRTRFEQDWNTPLAGRFAIIGGGTQAELNALLVAGRTALGQSANARLDAARFCGRRHAGAFAGRGVIGFCWPREGQPVTLGGVLPIMAHELMHQAQYELSADTPPRMLGSDRLLGPGWMVEGSAEVIELQAKGIPPTVTGSEFFNLQNAARRSRILLSDLTLSDAVRDSESYGVARFAALLLARKHGTSSLFTYFEALGRTADRDAAFETAFGQSFGAFETEFETLRRDFGAAQAYGGDAN